jgi:hypothetical protein
MQLGKCISILQRAHLEQHLLEPISIRVSQKLARSEEIKTLLMIGRNIKQGKSGFLFFILFVRCIRMTCSMMS